ncbi:reverse transcriptase domain-containing protein [Tanacetum coccineum]
MLGGTKTKKADALSKLASMTFEQLTKEVLVEVLAKGLINDKEVSKVEAKRGENWMIPIFEYLLSGLLLEDPEEARKIESRPRNIIMKQGYYWSLMHRDAAKIIQDCTQYQEFGVPKAITSKDDKQFREGIFAYLYSGLNVTQSFSTITGHVEIMNHIEKQLVRSQHGWADDLARVLLVHRTLPRNSQGKSPFTLTYGSEAIIPLAASLIQVSKGHSSKDKRKEIEGRA